jgi:hypothetical protein
VRRSRALLALLTLASPTAAAASSSGCSTPQCSETLSCGSPPVADATGPEARNDAPVTDVPVGDALLPDVSPSDGGRGDSALEAGDASAMDAPDTEASPTDGSGTADAPHADAGSCGTGFTCVPAVPTGFSGPVALLEETGDGGDAPPPPSCSGAYALDVVDGFETPIFSPASCSCVCGAVSGGCSMPIVETFEDNVCVNFCNQVLAGTCTLDACSQTSQSAKIIQGSQPSGGSCAPSVGAIVPPWSSSSDWATTLRACGATAEPTDAGCPAAQVCAVSPAPPFAATLCVWQAGNVTCPAAYPAKTVAYATGTDSRECSDQCTCGTPSGVACSATVTISSSSTCGSGTLILPGQCGFYSGTSTPYVSAPVTASSGSCAPGGTSSPTGTVTPSGATTVCCTQ